jgi:hypothetical protein
VLTPVSAWFTLSAVGQVRQAATRVGSSNNLKMIGLALLNYHNAHGHFPAAYIADANGKPLLSWRVALLPYIDGQDDLHRQFKLDEPWDSPNNKALLGRMYKVYAFPGDDPKTGMTRYRAFTGGGAAFDGPRPIRLTDITDGAENTLLVALAEDAVPWTKPDELTYDPRGPLPRLGRDFPSGAQVLYADGWVQLLPHDTPEATVRALITRSGGEPVTRP